jgi:putative transcriptional regulator
MIRFRLAELLADLNFRTGQRVEWQNVAEATGIHRTTLSKMLHKRGYNATTSNLDLLCRFFGCKTGDVIEYVPDEDVAEPVTSSFKGAKAGTPAAQAGATARHGGKPTL